MIHFVKQHFLCSAAYRTSIALKGRFAKILRRNIDFYVSRRNLRLGSLPTNYRANGSR